MKLLYTHENRFLVSNVQNLVQNAHITIMLKNEFAGGAAGDLVPHETWLEIWVNDEDFDTATAVISSSFSKQNDIDWTCVKCNEINDASFDFCWSCQSEAP
jgi:putative signal transducing protein